MIILRVQQAEHVDQTDVEQQLYFMYDVICSGILRVEVQFIVLIFKIYNQ